MFEELQCGRQGQGHTSAGQCGSQGGFLGGGVGQGWQGMALMAGGGWISAGRGAGLAGGGGGGGEGVACWVGQGGRGFGVMAERGWISAGMGGRWAWSVKAGVGGMWAWIGEASGRGGQDPRREAWRGQV